MAFQFEKLLVYQKAIGFADQTCSTTERFTRGCSFLVDQLNRASLSSSANIAEGNGRFTTADGRHFPSFDCGTSPHCDTSLDPTTDLVSQGKKNASTVWSLSVVDDRLHRL